MAALMCDQIGFRYPVTRTVQNMTPTRSVQEFGSLAQDTEESTEFDFPALSGTVENLALSSIQDSAKFSSQALSRTVQNLVPQLCPGQCRI